MTNPIADPLVEGVDSNADSPLVRIEAAEAGVATVWIERPERGNAFDALTVAALREAFETLHGAEGVRIVFVRGAGGQFCAGPDLAWMREAAGLPEDDNRADVHEIARMLKAAHDLPALTVALVEGAALGDGAGLVAACDMAVAVSGAEFGFPEVSLGLIPATIGPYVLAAVGPRRARRLFATGRAIDAAVAREIGLVDEVVADAAALEAAQARLIEDAMACAPGAVAETKRLASETWIKPFDHSLMRETIRRVADARASEEGREGVEAALAGRKASWSAF